jgi:hypothetical protein
MGAGINPFEVCSRDALGQIYEVFRGAANAVAADSFGAGGWRVRRDCEDDNDHEHHWQSDIAV